jgi:phosphopantothenoylcysteine decarboxylase/phosphopantothenate--cysteine ligase|tara:strand:- start:3538 stop:4713 length:1176 start_codon:yes stop_codon:yes gene_type:complete
MLKRKSNKLNGCKIALCITGSIAAIEAPKLAREMIRHGADITAYMSPDSQRILNPNAMEYATGKKVVVENTGKLEHIRNFDLIIIAPATATTIGKLAHGIGDNVVTALILSSSTNVLIVPAMHASMYHNPIIEKNVKTLRDLGFIFSEPNISEKAAKMATTEEITDKAISQIHKKDYKGLRVLITAGPTNEYIDPIRIITNKSSGKMGLAMAKEAFYRGAQTTLIMGDSELKCPGYIKKLEVETSKEMNQIVLGEINKTDIFISAAAVSDFTTDKSEKKISSKKELVINLIPAKKILDTIKNIPCTKVGFKALEKVTVKELTDASNLILKKYGLDLVVANDVSKDIFGSEETEIMIVTKDSITEIPRSHKSAVASIILNEVLDIRRKKDES